MLVAHSVENKRCIAWETEKEDGPFSCPECKGDTILKKGKIKEHHYAHKPPIHCSYGSGESQLHLKVKREIYSDLLQHPKCSKCELERRLDKVRPDISLYINKVPVAIEIQRSPIDIDTLSKRCIQYTKLGCYVLWILPNDEPYNFEHLIEDEYEIVCRPKQWEIFLHSIYFGRVYYWQSGAYVTPYHFSKAEKYVKETSSEWYDPEGNYQEESWGGYYKNLKSIKRFSAGGTIHIADEFRNTYRKSWESKNWSVPNCKLWLDKLEKWW